MTTTTMHFGPEWMRTKQPPARTAPSPPLAAPPPPTAPASSYSALVAPTAPLAPEKHDLSRPFKFSKEDLLRIYKEGGGRGGLGLEVERWEGIVREVGSDPVGLKDMSEGEKKIFAGPLNSEVRRRQSMDYLSPLSTERPKLGHLSSAGPGSPLRERMGNFAGRRRDSTDQAPLSLPRKQSFSSIQPPLPSPRDAPLPSPRTRIGASGFDGGVLDGPWTSKRRAAENAAKSGGKVDREPEKSGTDEKISEVEVSLGTVAQTDQDAGPSVVAGSGVGQPDVLQASSSMSSTNEPTLSRSAASADSISNSATPSGPPPGLDLGTVEWSYLDPQGQIQGPFPASTMQKWYDEGYFTPDLPMRRTHLETDWTRVRTLQQLAVSTPVFLTPLAPPRPPEPQPQPQPPPVAFASLNDTRYEPEMHRPHPTSALNARLPDGSNPSDSPMSSYSNPHFSNSSPDPSTFGARGMNGGHPDMTSSYSSLSSLDPQRDSPALDNRSHISHQAPIGRNGMVDGFGVNGYGNASPINGFNGGMDVHGGGMNGFHQPNDLGGMGNNHLNNYNMAGNDLGAALAGLRLDQRDMQPRYGGAFGAGVGSPFVGGQQYSPITPSPYMGQQDMRVLQQTSPFPVRRPSGSAHMLSLQQQGMQQPFVPQSSIPPQASRVVPEQLGYRRPGPFDVNYPTAQNTIVQQRTATPSQASSYSNQPVPPVPIQPVQNINVPSVDPVSWIASSHGVVPDGWGQEHTSHPSSLTVANLGQHNQLQEQEEEQEQILQTEEPESIAEPPAPELSPPPSEEVASPPSPEVLSVLAAEPTKPKTRRKSTAPASKPSSSPVIQPVVPAIPAKLSTPTPPPVDPKPAWNVDEDRGVLSLREIQEAEAKKAEARKAAERERAAARAAAAAAPAVPTPTEPAQTLTASWGLPTSQAGSRSNTSLVSKDSPSSPTPANAPAPQSAVWTNAVKPVAKKTMTMKEIQEEEERRKKQAQKEKETMAAAARRAYAETTTKTVPPATVGGAWTTVGSSGKTSVSTTPAVRPPAPAATPVKAAAIPSMASVVAPAPVLTQSNSGGVARSAIKRVEESPTPSQDFLKWLGETLKGLNSSVNLEEIASMLLQFPVDPDPSTVEIISDLIYANSTTLDGRRFAAEFVARRKASTKSTPSAGVTGKLSIADVVKTQPKPAQNEWSGFKVVNKKKKGGRA